MYNNKNIMIDIISTKKKIKCITVNKEELGIQDSWSYMTR